MLISRYVQNKNVRLFCEAIGEASDPAAILICGAGAHAHFWTDTFCETLVRAGYYVIRFDHRDCGLSSSVDFEKEPYTVLDLVSDVIAIIDAFKIQKAHVVGHSMGGTIAQLLSIFHPDRLLSFTSMSVGTLGENIAPSQEVMKALLENKPTENFERSLPGFMKVWKFLNGDFPLDEKMARDYTKEFYARSIHPVGVAWNHIHCQENVPDFSSKLSQVTIPGLFLHGEKDLLIPLKTLKKTSPSATQIMIPKMGHMILNQELQQMLAHLLLAHSAQASTIKKLNKI